MENNEDFIPLTQRTAGGANHQLVIITQLLQIAANIRHIDEMLLWLTHSIGQRLNLEAIQFWTNQNHLNVNRQSSTKLRAMACQHSAIPLHVLNNGQIAEVAGNLLQERHGVKSLPVGNVFPVSLSEMLTHYGLHYWTASFLSQNTLLPPMSDDISSGAIATPLAMVISLFSHQPIPMNLSANVSRIVEYALSIAKNRGLLAPTDARPFSSSGNLATHRAQPKPLTLDELILRRAQDVTAIQAGNPLAGAVVIADKRARRVYFAIDGKRSITEVLEVARVNKEELVSALSSLLKQKLVSLHEPDGKAVDSSLFLKPL